MKTNFSLLFYMKKQKNYQAGAISPIYLRITIDGTRSEVTTGRSIDPLQWNPRLGRAKGYKESVKSFNFYLDDLQVKIHEAHSQLTKENQKITAQILRDRFLGKDKDRPTLLEVFKEHNKKMESLVGTEFSKGTMERYRTSLKHTVEFLNWKYKIDDAELAMVNHEFIAEYDYYLRSVRKCANNSAVKYLKNFGKIIRIALSNGHLTANPLLNYKHTIKKLDRVHLTGEELLTITNKKMATERLEQVKDVFLFCCYTGLSYIDVKRLNSSDIVIGIDGENWISIKRQKTNVPSRIPLLPIAGDILNRYAKNKASLNMRVALPVLSNQKTNSYLKRSLISVASINR